MADYEQEFVNNDGQRLGLHRYRRSGNTAAVILPAMGVPAGYYRRFALELANTGVEVAVADLRGTGSSTPRPSRASDFGYAELLSDVGVYFSHLAPELAGRRTLLLGHSLGGQLAVLHLAAELRAATTPVLPIHGLSLLACGIPYHRLYGGRAAMVYGMAGFMSGTAGLLGHWPGYGFAGRQPRGVIRDWAHTVHKGTFVDIDGARLSDHFGDIKLPVLAVTMEGDQLTPQVTSRLLTDQLAAADVAEHHYTATESGTALDHFTWARASAPLTARLAQFMRMM